MLETKKLSQDKVTNLNCYLNFQLMAGYLLMVKYFKTLTTKIPNVFWNYLNKNV